MDRLSRASLDHALQKGITGVLLVGLVGWPLHLFTYQLATALGLDLAPLVTSLGDVLGLGGPGLRVVIYGALQFAILRQGARVRARFAPLWSRWKRQGSALAQRLPESLRLWGRLAVRVAAALVALLLLVQPSRAPLSQPSLGLRLANLVDGTASAALVDGAVAAVYGLTAEPVSPDAAPVAVEAYTATLDDPEVPLMDRWDAALLAAAQGDVRLAGQLKAIMWVESGGRQYALSHTGCAGLMQFCSGTAKDPPYRTIFGLGRVHTCACTPCTVPRAVQVALETDPEAVVRHARDVPCPLRDARFDGPRSLRAAAHYVRKLAPDVGGSLLLVYVGYNAGPRVARTVYKRLGRPDEVAIDDLRPHLASALRPTFGRRAEARANGLLDVHLPKLQRAWDRWGRD